MRFWCPCKNAEDTQMSHFLNFASFLVKIGFANIVLMKFYLWRWNATVGNIFLVWACNELPLRRLWGVVKNVWLKCALFLSKMFQWNWFIFFKQQRSNINPFSKCFTSREIKTNKLNLQLYDYFYEHLWTNYQKTNKGCRLKS